jgi:hypothetical protein
MRPHGEVVLGTSAPSESPLKSAKERELSPHQRLSFDQLEVRSVPATIGWADCVIGYVADAGEANRLTVTNGGRTFTDTGAAIAFDPTYFTGGGGVGQPVTLKPEYDV